MMNEYGNIDLDYLYSIITVNLTDEENKAYEAVKNQYGRSKMMEEVFYTEIKNKAIEKNNIEHPIPSMLLILFHYIKIFESGTIYICCNPEQAEHIRSLAESNRNKFDEFELKVIVGNNIIKFI